jgi:hypothetical protein
MKSISYLSKNKLLFFKSNPDDLKYHKQNKTLILFNKEILSPISGYIN